jgi:hypothetical protein
MVVAAVVLRDKPVVACRRPVHRVGASTARSIPDRWNIDFFRIFFLLILFAPKLKRVAAKRIGQAGGLMRKNSRSYRAAMRQHAGRRNTFMMQFVVVLFKLQCVL